MLMSDIAPYRSALRQSWQALVTEAELDPSAFKPSVLWRRIDPWRVRFVLKLTNKTGPDLVFKKTFKPEGSSNFMTGISAQDRVSNALQEPTTTPKILAYSEKDQSLLMDCVPGETAHDALFNAGGSPAEQARLLGAAGQWIGAFHRAFAEPPRRFQARHILKHMQNRLAEFDKTSHKIRHPEHYHRALTALLKTGADADGAELPVGLNHGDLHSKNIIIGADRVSGIDFRNNHTAPACYDLGRFLVDGVVRTVGPSSTGKTFLDPELSAAFWEGYGVDLADNSAMNLMIKVRLLEDWIAIPDGRLNRMQRRRFDNILAISGGLLSD